MSKYFGTDGVRGIANKDLTPELAFKVGRCGGYVLTKETEKLRYSLVVIHAYQGTCWKMHSQQDCSLLVQK